MAILPHKRMHFLTWLITWVLLIGSFSVIGFLLVAQATGYRYNEQIGKWQKTGMLIARVDPLGSSLHMGGINLSLDEEMERLTNLLPGSYRLRISKQGYTTWQESISIKPGFVVNLEPITLFYEDPIEIAASPDHERRLTDSLPDTRVSIQDNELWVGTDLVTRFTHPPSIARLLPTDRHIIYVQGNQIRIIETNGQRDTLLFERSTDTPTPLLVFDNSVVVFKDGDLTRAIEIR